MSDASTDTDVIVPGPTLVRGDSNSAHSGTETHPSATEPAPHGNAGAVATRELLEDSERLWAQDPARELACGGSVDARHRRRLVLRALCAYERLRAEQAPDAEALTVFRQWPACTLVSTVALAASSSGEPGLFAELAWQLVGTTGSVTDPQQIVDPWLHGWAESWQKLVGTSELGKRVVPGDVPGLGLLLTASGIVTGETAAAELRLDLARGAVVVTIPGARPELWSVHADGVACTSAGEQWIVPHPAARIECRDVLDRSRTLPLVDADDPLLVFDDTGNRIPAEQPVRASEVWLLHRGEPPAEAFDGERRVLEHAGTPPGWTGWWLGKVALDGTRAVRSAGGDGTGTAAYGPWRENRPSTAASGAAVFEFGSAIPMLYDSRDGSGNDPVYATAPHLRLPETSSWTVGIADADAEREISSHAVHGGETVDLARLLPRPAVGRFRVRVTGSGRQRVTSTFTLAENLDVRARPTLRMLRQDDGSLYPAKLWITTPPGVQAAPPSFHLKESHIGRRLRLSRAGEHGTALTLWVQPPYTALRKRVRGRAGTWETKALRFPVHELHEEIQLDLSLPEGIREEHRLIPGLTAHTDTGELVQHLRGHRLHSSNVIRYNLTALTDTTAAHGLLRLRLELPNQEALVATTYVPPPASDARCDGTRVRLLDRVPTGALRVSIHAVFAPWLRPQIQELPEGTDEIVLREPFRHGGPLLVTVVPADAEMPTGWPKPAEPPRSGVVFRIGAEDQVPQLPSAVAGQMASYLAGQAPLPDTRTGLLLLWVGAARPGATPDSAPARSTAQECAARLQTTPLQSLTAAAEARLSGAELVGTLIRSGLAAHRLSHVAEPDRIRRMWAMAPLPALLLTSPLLPYLSGDPQWDRTELEPDEEQLLDELPRHCAPLALDVLTGDRTAPADSGLPPLLPETRPGTAVPSPGEDALTGVELPEDATDCLGELQSFATTSGHVSAFDVLYRRGESYGERQARAAKLSLGSGLVARIAAQGDGTAARLEQRLRHLWVEIALHAPELAANDLALAEFLTNSRDIPKH